MTYRTENTLLSFQMDVQDLPSVPNVVPPSSGEEKLDLPDVPTKAPVAPVSVSTAKKGLSLSLSL